MSFLDENGRPKPLPARTINPLTAFPSTYEADKAEAVLRRAVAGGYVPVWQIQSIWHHVRCDANRIPGMNEMDLATAKCLLRREKKRPFYLHCHFDVQQSTWGWRTVMYAHQALAALWRFQTIPYENRYHLFWAYQSAVTRWSICADIHAKSVGVTLPKRIHSSTDEGQDALVDVPGVVRFRTEYSPVPPGMSEREWRYGKRDEHPNG